MPPQGVGHNSALIPDRGQKACQNGVVKVTGALLALEKDDDVVRSAIDVTMIIQLHND